MEACFSTACKTQFCGKMGFSRYFFFFFLKKNTCVLTCFFMRFNSVSDLTVLPCYGMNVAL